VCFGDFVFGGFVGEVKTRCAEGETWSAASRPDGDINTPHFFSHTFRKSPRINDETKGTSNVMIGLFLRLL
jgi:hypothetical protein